MLMVTPLWNLSIIPGFVGTQRLTRLIDPGYAKQMILTGNQFSDQQALAMGLVNEVVPTTSTERVDALAQSIASGSPNGIRLAKEAIEHGLQGSLNEGLQLEAALFGLKQEFSSLQKTLSEYKIAVYNLPENEKAFMTILVSRLEKLSTLYSLLRLTLELKRVALLAPRPPSGRILLWMDVYHGRRRRLSLHLSLHLRHMKLAYLKFFTIE